jgi:hypothetical protein
MPGTESDASGARKTAFNATVTRCYPGPGMRPDEALIVAISESGLPIEFVGPRMPRWTKITVTIKAARHA